MNRTNGNTATQPSLSATWSVTTRDCESYWDRLSPAYQAETRISVDDFHYGPLLPGDRALGLLPRDVAGLRCLELGCGAAQNSIVLARRGAVCTALDISRRQLRAGGKLARQHGVSIAFVHGTMDHLPFGLERFDLIHSTYGLPFVEHPEEVLQRMAELLSPGGVLLLTVGHPLYSGEWIEADEEDDGLFLRSYFRPDADVRTLEDGTTVTSRYAPLSDTFGWLRQAGLTVDRLLEPMALPVALMSEQEIREQVPYESDAWRELAPYLMSVPVVAIFRAIKNDGG